MRNKDLIGQKFGTLTVERDSGKRQGSSVLWLCRCDCGREVLAVRHHLVNGIARCSCTPKPPQPRVTDLIGRRFGKLTVVEDSGARTGSGVILWRCRCDCGGEILARRQQLVSGNQTNCGCVPRIYAPRSHAEDLTGRQFGNLTVLYRGENDKNNHVCWVCRCECGREVTVQAIRLKSGHTRSCGCKRYHTAYNRYDLTGQRFGRLTALYHLHKEEYSKSSYWHCRCDCGNELDVHTGSLLHGRTRSCGCWNREQSGKMHDYMHYQDDTCVEMLQRACSVTDTNKAGFRGLFLTKTGKYRVMITFQKKHYTLGYYKTFEEAVKVRLNAEEDLHEGYINAFKQYEKKAESDPAWAENNPFFYQVTRINGGFQVYTNGIEEGYSMLQR